MPNLTASQTLPKMPICLPKNSPAAMPSGSGANSCSAVSPLTSTPALAKPKIGTIAKATHGWSPCSSRWSGEVWLSGAPGVRSNGIAIAASTPAMVAWTPDSSIAYQSKAKASR